MRVAHINRVYPYGSTGKIVKGINELCLKRGYETRVCFGYSDESQTDDNCISMSSYLDTHIHNRLARLTGFQGFFSFFKTLSFLKELKEFNPDLIHMHNIHDSYVNHFLLFSYIKKHEIPVVWTQHDCWAFTGLCYHFQSINCLKWRDGCGHCPMAKNHDLLLFDSSAFCWKVKKRLYAGLDSMYVVTPSKWLSELVSQSYLAKYPCKVIHNGIDLSVFYPRGQKFREERSLSDKCIVLGVSFGWSSTKGLDVFLELAEKLSDKFQIVIVGVDNDLSKELPKNIIGIPCTRCQDELAEMYSAADIFVNPTREDTFPTVNMEALACGTPVITFKTGGSAEIISKDTGIAIEKGDVPSLIGAIEFVKDQQPFTSEACVKHAKKFSKEERFAEYLDLYEVIAGSHDS